MLVLELQNKSILAVLETQNTGLGATKYMYLSHKMLLQRISNIVGDAGFELGTSASEVWCATNEPPHFLVKPPHLQQ